MGDLNSKAHHVGGVQRSRDALVSNLVDKLFDGALKAPQEEDLGTMTVGKAGSFSTSHVSSSLVANFVPTQRLPFGLVPSLARRTPITQSSVFVRAENDKEAKGLLPSKTEL